MTSSKQSIIYAAQDRDPYLIIAPAKWALFCDYKVLIFSDFSRYMLSVLIRGTSNEYPQHTFLWKKTNKKYLAICIIVATKAKIILCIYDQGPVAQSIVSLTSSLRVILLIILGDSIYNILIVFAEKM